MKRTIIIMAAGLLAAGSTASAQQTIGTLVVAHGADSTWNSHVHQAAARANTGGPVDVTFLMGPEAKVHPFQAAVSKLEKAGATHIVVVPLLVSSYSGHYEQIRYLAGATDELSESMLHHLHMGGIERPDTRARLVVTPAIDDATQAAQVLSDRVRALSKDLSSRSIFLIGHGPNDPEDLAAWMTNMRAIAGNVKTMTSAKDVRVGVVQDDAPATVRAEAVTRTREIIELQAAMSGSDVIVVPLLISSGSLARQKLPVDLSGLPFVYMGEPLLPHDAMVDWIEMRVRQAASAYTKAN